MIPMHEVYRLDNKHAKRVRYQYDIPTANGEMLSVEFTRGVNDHSSNSLPHVWFKEGYTPTELDTWWDVQTYYSSKDGMHAGYNPAVDRIECTDERRAYTVPQYNFEWILEATDENMHKILREIESHVF